MNSFYCRNRIPVFAAWVENPATHKVPFSSRRYKRGDKLLKAFSIEKPVTHEMEERFINTPSLQKPLVCFLITELGNMSGLMYCCTDIMVSTSLALGRIGCRQTSEWRISG